jgi:hypothetical protein
MPQDETQREPKKLAMNISDEAEGKHREKALDQAIENTFPASDPVSAEQPVQAHGLEIQRTTIVDSPPGRQPRRL